VRGFCRPLIADYKLPELFRIGCEPLLRNQNGKFDKPALRALAANEPLRTDTKR
jgi:acyl-CoA synthetase (AMP-forming)/AMP-acid ligase II